MNKPGPVSTDVPDAAAPVFVSYATPDRKEALAVCKAIERRGPRCWISTRDVEPGENYQESIVRALRGSRAMVLVFSDAANNSDEIKKELSLASRYRIPVMALRIEDVDPSDAFAYELSTRQWIDAFENWDKSIDALVRKIEQASGDSGTPAAAPAQAPRRRASIGSRKPLAIAASAALLLILAALAAWMFLRPSNRGAAHSMQVRLGTFQRLSPDVPDTMPAALADEINAAFNDDGIVSVSTAPAPPPGNDPAYAISGTIRREAGKYRVIVRLLNERSNATLWSNSFSYDEALAARVPHLAAVNSSMTVRCGLFAAATYPKALPDNALIPYLGYCEGEGSAKSLNFARRVVQVAPDFSWGWSAVADSLALSAVRSNAPDNANKEAEEAADKALKLDPTNSDAYLTKAFIVDPTDLVKREALLKKAIDATPLACGCEHHMYGLFLLSVGRVQESVAEFQRAIAVLPLNFSTQGSFGSALLYAGDISSANKAFDAAADLDPDPTMRRQYAVEAAPFTRDYVDAAAIIDDPKVQAPQDFKTAISSALRALASGSPTDKAKAAQLIQALRPMALDLQLNLLGALGAPQVAMQKLEAGAKRGNFLALGTLWGPNLAAVRSDPAFPALAGRLGLIRYWRTSHTKPDVCKAAGAAPFCRMI